MYIACTNCEDTKEVKLRNDLGQVYEIRKCPVCICKACNGTGLSIWPEPFQFKACYMCGPQRFSAHVRAYRKHMRPVFKVVVRPGEIPIGWPAQPKPTTFQRCIEWIKSLCK